MSLFLKLILFVAVAALSFKYHYAQKSPKYAHDSVQSRNLSDGQYSSPSAQNEPHLIVYGIPCVATRKYTGMLDQNDVPYLYKDMNQAIRSAQYNTDILPRMAASHITPQDVTGPLVDINGRFYLMPDIETIRKQMSGR